MPFLKYKRLKLKLRVCCYGNLLRQENNTNVFISDCVVFFNQIVTSIDEEWL